MRRREFGGALLFGGAALALAPTAALAADTLEEIKKKGVLRVGVEAAYPPFGFRSSNGELIGIGPDLGRDLAKHLGVKADIVPVTAANRMQFLNQGHIDIIIATMNVTPERAKILEYVKPYYYASGYSLLLPKSLHVTSWSQVKGKPVCGTQGAFYNKEASQKYGIHVIAFPGDAEALAALKEGRCIAFLEDNTLLEGLMREPEWKSYEMPLDTQEAGPWGMGVRKGDTHFAQVVGNVIKDWDKTGFILQLETKYGITRHSKFAEAMHKKYE